MAYLMESKTDYYIVFFDKTTSLTLRASKCVRDGNSVKLFENDVMIAEFNFDNIIGIVKNLDNSTYRL